MKRIISAWLIFCLLLSCMLCPAFAADDEDFDHVIASGMAVITNYAGADVNVVVPQTLSGCPVGEIAPEVFAGNKKIVSVTLPDSVTDIADEQFAFCTSLQRVVFGKNVRSIGVSAFAGCTVLREMTVPDSVIQLGAGAFQDCSALRTLTIGKGVTALPGDLCNMCSSLRTVYLGENVTSVGRNAFAGCFWTGGDLYAGKVLTALPDEALDIDFNGTVHCYRDTALYRDLLDRGYKVEVYAEEEPPVVIEADLRITNGGAPVTGALKKKIGLFSSYRKNPVQLGITGIDEQYIQSVSWRATEGGFRVQDGTVTHTGWFAATGVVQVTVKDVNGDTHTASLRIVFYRLNLQMLLRFAAYR